MQVKLLSWNVAGRVGVLAAQTEAVARQEPDIVALQEVRPSTAPVWRDALAAAGLGHAIDSSAFANGRRIFNLVASRWELIELPPIGAPQPERVLSAVIDSPAGPDRGPRRACPAVAVERAREGRDLRGAPGSSWRGPRTATVSSAAT